MSYSSIEEELAVSSVNLAADGASFVSWLGYRISAADSRLQIGIAEAAWAALQRTLSELRFSRDASIRAAWSVEQARANGSRVPNRQVASRHRADSPDRRTVGIRGAAFAPGIYFAMEGTFLQVSHAVAVDELAL